MILKLFAHTAQCCHLAHPLSCKLLKVRKQVYQQRDLCFLYQLLRPMQLVPKTTVITISIASWNLEQGQTPEEQNKYNLPHKSTHLDQPPAMNPVFYNNISICKFYSVHIWLISKRKQKHNTTI
jgi:hypothetical protein